MSYAPTDPATAPALLAVVDTPDTGPDGVVALRLRARDHFAATGLPSLKSETWRNTSLRGLSKLTLVAADDASGAVDALPSVRPAGNRGARVVLVNGKFRPDLSDVTALPDDAVKVVELGAAADRCGDDFTSVVGTFATFEDHPLVALNTASLADGVVILIGHKTRVDPLVEIVHVTVGAEGATPLSQPRSFIVVGHQAHATVVEHHIGAGYGGSVFNHVSEIAVAEGATLRHYTAQRAARDAYHFNHTAVWVSKDAAYEAFALNLGGKLSRHEIRVKLGAEGASCILDGAYMIDGEQLADTTTRIEHMAENTTSREVYKGTLDGKSHGVFQGKIVVHPGAMKTDGHQLSRALLLSDFAGIDAKPELEIFADDVKCSHGSTCGELDDAALFFLRARGIPKEEARALLVGAFVQEALDSISDDTVRAGFTALVDNHLAAKAQARLQEGG